MKDIHSRYLSEKKARAKLGSRPDLRERQKQLAKEDVLNAALDLFSRHGYVKTTMQMIADKAGVGVATVFRNFGTKGAILAALVHRDLEEVFDAGWQIVLDPSPHLSATIVALVNEILRILDKPSKTIRTPSHLWPAVIIGKAEIDEVVLWADKLTQVEVYGALVEYEKKYRKKLPFDAADMAMNIFYIFNGHYAAYLAHEDKDAKQLKSDLERRINIILPTMN